ncbi:hypothetical protein CONLIGDRAFT_697526 [Coniochaeta ligniaria NRRL 30616]|uniref:F-box domain-containing protein n=1 Tax=Coniochaeta ligniaria NRRL 30616 TaxID=1408157 RepID=A0A1J7I4S2_9PEZI|nr:hypothetical protein CONLIGDRAFT_697526 [Coniochaeta ligniaria NRRL 30616]
MSNSRLERLPTELLWSICEYVGFSHRPTMLSLAMASKRCHSVVKPLLFRTIKFSADSPVQLALDVLKCTGILQRNSAFADVCILVIDSRSRIQAENYGDALTSGSRFSGLPLSVADMIDGDPDRLHGLESRSFLTAKRARRGADSADQMDAAWQSLADLVQRFQALSDVLIWMDYEETDGYDGEGMPSYSTQFVSSMVQTLVPNLKEVHMIQSAGSPEDEDGNPLPPPPPWKGLSVGNDVARAPASLTCLELGQASWYNFSPLILEAAVVDSWAASTKLSLLRTLTISRAVSHESLKSLMLVGNSLSRLTTLLFTCMEGHEHTYYDDVKRFLRCLPQLTSLEMIAWLPSISLAAALPRRLRELWLRTQHVPGQGHDEAGLAELADRCPVIQTLAVRIRRSRGDLAEVALYRALGRFARLRRLALTLDASPPPWFPAVPPSVGYDTAIDPSFDEFDRCYLTGGMYPYRNGNIRDVLINSAVDETLARAIFQTVCAAQARNHPHSHGIATATTTTTMAPLERMTLQVEGSRAFPQRGNMMPPGEYLRPYLAVLSSRWLLERDLRDDARDVVHARVTHERAPGQNNDPSWYMPIFRRIWPETPGGSADWRHDWRSMPLASDLT